MTSIRCTVLPGGTGAGVDLDLCGPSGTAWISLLPQVLHKAGLDPTATVSTEGSPLPDAALLGHPPLLDGVLLTTSDRDAAQPRPLGLLELHVVGGPDSGRVHPLPPGEHRVGRSPQADVVVADPGASRAHALLTVGAAGVRVRDLGSVNGTVLDETTLSDTCGELVAGQRFRVGDTTLVLRSPAVRLATTRPTGAGTVELNRAPRPTPSTQPVLVRRPAAVADSARHRWPLAAMLLPLAIAVPIALVTGQPVFLLFALMSPVMMLANVLSERSRSRREARAATAVWQQQTRDTDELLARALAAELAARRVAAPDAGELLRAALRPSARLWERAPGSPDTLHLLIGTGTVRSDVRLTGVDGAPEPLHLTDAPVVVALTECGHLGIAGPRQVTLGVVRHLVAQLAVWHAPQSVRLLLLARDAEAAADWQWVRWLPHSLAAPLTHAAEQVQPAVTALLETIAERQEARGSAPWTGTRTVVVIDRASTLRSVVGLAELMRQGPHVGVHVVCLDVDLASLPSGVGATLDLQHRTGALVVEGGTACDVRWDAVSAGWAERVARALAPVRDATPSTDASALPADVRLVDLLPCDARDPRAVAQLWAARPSTTQVVVGVDQDGPAELDLRRDGPHALVAGTTGAGKSELLRTLVVALAVANRPDELSMVLVDYKGGAAFAGCAELPHVSGVVTDLDAHLAERALESLGAELTRRERALAAARCEDLEAYQVARQRDPSLAPAPRLVVVIDEFRMLAQELPSFVTGLVRVAAVGRSLGVHLVLATQRPAGIVSADIKANVSLRIALRLRDRSDSDDVIESGDAARLDPATPGRAVWRGGSGGLRTVQVARVSGCSDVHDTDRVAVRRSGRPLEPSDGDATRLTGPDDLTRVTAAVRQAAADGAIVSAPAAWLPPLPQVLTPDAVPAAPASSGVVLGLVDLPEQQAQPALTWHPAHDGHLGVHGPSRSGRTSALAGVAIGLSRVLSPAEVHLHVLDGGGGRLRDLAALPHTGTVLTRDQPRLVARFVERLAEQVAHRQEQPGSGGTDPLVVLLIDGWDGLVEALDAADHGRTSEALLGLLRDGPAAGLGAVISGGRALLTSRLSAAVPDRLLLRVVDPTDLLLAGLPSSALPATSPPGRGVRTRDGATVQLTHHGDDVAAAVRASAGTWPGWREDGDRIRVAELPARVLLDDLTARAAPDPGSRRVLVGLGGDGGTPTHLHLGTDPVAVVAGPGGSGRSTTLRTLARGLRLRGVDVIAVCPRPSALQDGPWPTYRPDDEALLRLLAERPDACVLVDDAEALGDTSADALLDQLIRARGHTAVVLGGTASGLLGCYRGAVASARASGTGVLLGPTAPSDGEVLGVRALVPDRRPTGRGLLIVRGHQQPVQVAS